VTAVLALVAWVIAQDPAGWVVHPGTLTVGDTVWLERRIALPSGWTVRPLRLAPGGSVEPLGDPVAVHDVAGWRVRYPVVAWTTGSQRVEMPLQWRLGPLGEADSVAGGVAAFEVASVLPDTGDPVPQPPRPLLRRAERRPWWPAGAVALAMLALGAGVRGRRRAPRADRATRPAAVDEAVPDDAWLAAGEPRAVAARAVALLRAALAAAVPEASSSLTTDECLVVLERARPAGAIDDIAATLRGLERAAFGQPDSREVAALATRARALAAELGR